MFRFSHPIFNALLIPAAGFLLVLTFGLLVSTPALAQEAPFGGLNIHDEPIEDIVERILSELSSEEMVGQVFLLGWQGEGPSATIMDWIRRRNLGGVKIFGWNADHIPTLVNSIRTMQAAALGRNGIPLFTATDQEGGWVRHVRGNTAITPGNMAIGAGGLPQDAYLSGYHIGKELNALGINMNFAPTVDLYTNPEAVVIGPRAFSDDPVQSGILGAAFARGLSDTGVLATGKHFPGHGNADGDSHGVLPVLNETLEELRDRELVPFRIMIREGVPALMSAHLAFPAIDPRGTPASLSSRFQRDILRDELGFEGIIITDDLYMGGATVYQARTGRSFAEICLEALIAGNDMIMLSRTPAINDAIWRVVHDRYLTDPEFATTIRNSVRRILRAKITMLKADNPVPVFPTIAEANRVLGNQDGRDFFFQSAARGVTVLRNGALPIDPANGNRILLVGNNPRFFSVGRRFYPNAAELRLNNINPAFSTAADREMVPRVASNYDTIIFNVSSLNTFEVVSQLRDMDVEVVVLSVLSPSRVRDLDWVGAKVAVYGWGNESFESGFAVLRGDFTSAGTLPLNWHETLDQLD
ncbi:MAG: glycoside hydrolase family 3 protein [Spirochaetaceae bacterium]|nr:MAG: glycoside hydrolase family 3 protein [Spirochaetaceae bacterium]